MKNIFLELERVYLRYISRKDFDILKSMLQDREIMYAWEYLFSDDEVWSWIDRTLECYKRYNLGYFIIEDKLLNSVIGQAALMPDIIQNKQYYEISYMLKKPFWSRGYATECAEGLAKYAFTKLNLNEVIFEIRPENRTSCKVAERLGAAIDGSFIKNVKGKRMRHLIYKLKK